MHLVKSRKTLNLSDKRKINGELSNKQDCMFAPNHKHSGLNWQMILHFLLLHFQRLYSCTKLCVASNKQLHYIRIIIGGLLSLEIITQPVLLTAPIPIEADHETAVLPQSKTSFYLEFSYLETIVLYL